MPLMHHPFGDKNTTLLYLGFGDGNLTIFSSSTRWTNYAFGIPLCDALANRKTLQTVSTHHAVGPAMELHFSAEFRIEKSGATSALTHGEFGSRCGALTYSMQMSQDALLWQGYNKLDCWTLAAESHEVEFRIRIRLPIASQSSSALSYDYIGLCIVSVSFISGFAWTIQAPRRFFQKTCDAVSAADADDDDDDDAICLQDAPPRHSSPRERSLWSDGEVGDVFYV